MDSSNILLTIQDDGLGLPEGRTANGFGLAGMRERVRSVGGLVSVRNRPGGLGVTVEAQIPIRRESDPVNLTRQAS
jgi:signal transduction histidine kinase